MSSESDQPTRDWNQSYREGDTPWDSGIRSRELARVLDETGIEPCRALELGCGAGTNAVFLAERGFEVTGVDIAPAAIEQARQLASEHRVGVQFVEADVCRLDVELGRFDFVFDRGCYHCARRIDLPGFVETLRTTTQPGTRYLVLVGNANEKNDEGPPRLHEHEIRDDWGELFEFEFVREIRFEDRGGVDGPLGWSCLLRRRTET